MAGRKQPREAGGAEQNRHQPSLFDQLLVFEEAEKVRYTITRNPVIGGNVRTVTIDQDRFRTVMSKRTEIAE